MTAKLKKIKKIVGRLKYQPESGKKTIRGRILHYSIAGSIMFILFCVVVGCAGVIATAIIKPARPTAACSTNCPVINSNTPAASSDTALTKSASSADTTNKSGCTTTSIPYGVTDENDDALASGHTQVVSKGVNGLRTTCPGKPATTITPGNEIIDVGTGKDAAQTETLQQQEAAQTNHSETCATLENEELAAGNAVQQDENNQTYYRSIGGAAYAQWEAKLQQDQETYNNLVAETGGEGC